MGRLWDKWFDLWDGVYMVLARFICRVFDHKLVSDDIATPDSGYMGAHCERCWQSWGSWLY